MLLALLQLTAHGPTDWPGMAGGFAGSCPPITSRLPELAHGPPPATNPGRSWPITHQACRPAPAASRMVFDVPAAMSGIGRRLPSIDRTPNPEVSGGTMEVCIVAERCGFGITSWVVPE